MSRMKFYVPNILVFSPSGKVFLSPFALALYLTGQHKRHNVPEGEGNNGIVVLEEYYYVCKTIFLHYLEE